MTVFSVKDPSKEKKKSKLTSRELFIKETFYGTDKETDFCKNYKLEDQIQEIVFNKRFNQVNNVYVFDRKNNFSKLFFNSIDTRINRKSHIVLYIFGKTNSGKSEVAQSIAKYIEKKFFEIRNVKIKIHLVFSDAESKSILPNMDVGDVYLSDEKPKVTGTGSRVVEWNLGNVTEIVRKNQNSFIFVKPKKKNEEYIDYYLETAGKNYKKRETRCLLYDENFDLIGRIFIKLHEDEQFRNRYEKRKDENIRRTLSNSGEVNVEIDPVRFNKDFEKLLDISERIGLKSMNKINTQISLYNKKTSDKKEWITGSPTYITDLVNSVHLVMKGRIKKSDILSSKIPEKKDEKDSLDIYRKFKFRYNMKKIIDLTKKESNLRNVDRDFDIWRDRENGVLIKNILKSHNDLNNPGAITVIQNKVTGQISRIRGKIFETEYYKYLKDLKIYDRVEKNGRNGKPDIYAYFEPKDELHVFSCKCYDFKKSNPIFLIEDLRPEYVFSNENVMNYSNVKMFVVAYDMNENKCHVKEVNFSKPGRVKINTEVE